MGVHGLTTYLRENERALGRPLQFPPAHRPRGSTTTVVVDGLSFIYQLYDQSRLPWVYGGEYGAFAACVVQVVQAWLAVGLTVYFVFDGPSPVLKIPTIISRLNRTNVRGALLFFRTSPTSRSTPRFLRENRIIPPLVFLSCIETLESLAKLNPGLEVHFADEEGDPYAVELAGRLAAYVVGNDSDFVILNSGRYAGYISLEDMSWSAPLLVIESPETHNDHEDGFQTVTSKNKKRSRPSPQQTSFGLIPPEGTSLSDLVLSAVVYTPSTLASHLKLPTTLLPLLASLVGNDYSNKSTTQHNVQSLFFERNMTLSQRITHTANTLSSIINAATQKCNAKYRVGSVVDLIDRTVNALLVRSPSTLAAGEIGSTIDGVVTAALQYAIDKYEGDVYGPASLWQTPTCALHGAETCPLRSFFSCTGSQSKKPGMLNETLPEDNIPILRSLYLKAFRAGKLQPKIMDILRTGTHWPRIFLDNPDMENVAISIGRPVRLWIYALLEDGIGLAQAQEEGHPLVDSGVSEGDETEEDLDELIDVAEDDSGEDTDPLAPLRGELRRIRGTEEDAPKAASTSFSSRSCSRPPARPRCITEYVRRGTRIAPEKVPVPDLAALMFSSGFNENVDPDGWIPVQLRSLEERRALFLHILGSNVPAVRNVAPDQLMAVLVLRWIIQTLYSRALESGTGSERDKERWTHQEGRMFLAFYGLSATGDDMMAHAHAHGIDTESPTTISLMDRNVQLMAQILMAVETLYLLSQVLFLTDQVPANIQTLSGQKLHAYLTNSIPAPVETLPPGLWDACTASLEDAFAPERQKKSKKPRVDPNPAATKHKTKTRPGKGLFSLLVDDGTDVQ